MMCLALVKMPNLHTFLLSIHTLMPPQTIKNLLPKKINKRKIQINSMNFIICPCPQKQHNFFFGRKCRAFTSQFTN